MSKETGGSAFPQSGAITDSGDLWRSSQLGGEGMSLRDYFAAKAMQGDWAAQNEITGEFVQDTSDEFLLKAAGLYYRMADAMLAARNK